MNIDVKKTATWLCLIYGIFGIYVILLLFCEPVRQAILNFVAFFTSFDTDDLLWIFALIFIFMAIGNGTNIPVGIPAVYFFSKSIPSGDFFWFFLVVFSMVAGFGAATGELVIYAIGRGAAKALKNRGGVINMQYFVRLISIRRSSVPLLVYLFGLTPLPDQFIIIPLGVAKYSVKNIFLPCGLGKGSFALIISIGATLFHQAATVVTEISLIQEGLFLAIVLTALLAFMSIKWEPIFKKYTKNLASKAILAGNKMPGHSSEDEEDNSSS